MDDFDHLFNQLILMVRMVDYLIQKGKFEKLLAPSRKNLSSLYKRRIANTCRVYLDNPAVRSKIEFKKK